MKQFLKNIFLSKRDLVGAPRGFSFEYDSKKELIEELYGIVKQNGFQEVNTPVFDFFEVYEKVLGSGVRELFVFKDGNDFIVPRYDTTTQIVRFLAPRIKNLKLPVKLFYYSDVFREPSFKWYPRQIKQFGIEIIGGSDEEIKSMFEILKNIIQALNKHNQLKEYKLVFNFSNIIDAIVSRVEEEDRDIVLYLLANKDLPSLEKVVEKDIYKNIEELVFIVLEDGIESVKNKSLSLTGVSEDTLKDIDTIVNIFGEENVVFDPTLTPNMDYYSGVFFKVFSDKQPTHIVSGGRYDNLTKKFGYSQTAMGFALDILP